VSDEKPLNNVESRYTKVISGDRRIVASARSSRDELRVLLSQGFDNLKLSSAKSANQGPLEFPPSGKPFDEKLQSTICTFLLNDYSLRVACLEETLSRLVDGAVFHNLKGFSLPSPWCLSVIFQSLGHRKSDQFWKTMREKLDINPTSSDVLLLSQFPDSFFEGEPSGADSTFKMTTGTVFPLLKQWRRMFLHLSATEEMQEGDVIRSFGWGSVVKKVRSDVKKLGFQVKEMGSRIWNRQFDSGSQENTAPDHRLDLSWNIPWSEAPELVDQLFEMPALRGVRRRYGRSFAIQSGSALPQSLELPAIRKESGHVPAGFIAMVCEHLEKLLLEIREQDLEFPEKRRITEEKFMTLVAELEVSISGPSELNQQEVRSQISEWLDGLKQQWEYQPEYLGLDPDGDPAGIGLLSRGLD